jgi:ribosomal 50S subunit-recycling heat shock protein
MRKQLFVIAAIMVFSFALVSFAVAQSSDKPAIEKTAVAKITATVEKIDYDKRLVTLKGPEGNLRTIKVGEEARNFSQVKVGDKVAIEFYESILVEVLKPGEAKPGAQAGSVVGRAKPGEKPAGVAINTITVTATIDKIDKKAQTVTLKGPEGNKETVKVKDPKNLKKVKVGDNVVISYTEALAISVEKAQ